MLSEVLASGDTRSQASVLSHPSYVAACLVLRDDAQELQGVRTQRCGSPTGGLQGIPQGARHSQQHWCAGILSIAQPPVYCWLRSQDICLEFGIPTAHSQRFSDAAAAKDYIRGQGVPIVVKADGLAAGKGVVVAHDEQAALAAVDAILVERRFGDAGPPAAQHACAVPAQQLPTLLDAELACSVCRQ